VSEEDAGKRLAQVVSDPALNKSGVYWSWSNTKGAFENEVRARAARCACVCVRRRARGGGRRETRACVRWLPLERGRPPAPAATSPPAVVMERALNRRAHPPPPHLARCLRRWPTTARGRSCGRSARSWSASPKHPARAAAAVTPLPRPHSRIGRPAAMRPQAAAAAPSARGARRFFLARCARRRPSVARQRPAQQNRSRRRLAEPSHPAGCVAGAHRGERTVERGGRPPRPPAGPLLATAAGGRSLSALSRSNTTREPARRTRLVALGARGELACGACAHSTPPPVYAYTSQHAARAGPELQRSPAPHVASRFRGTPKALRLNPAAPAGAPCCAPHLRGRAVARQRGQRSPSARVCTLLT
jgi:hypothetical protein